MLKQKPAVLVLLLSLCGASPVFAHDLYLVTNVPGAEDRVCARVGEHFPEPMSHLSADRVGRFQLHTDKDAAKLQGTAEEKQFCASIKADAGIVEMTVPPRYIQLGGKDFTSYLTGEGLTAVLQARQKAGKSDAPATELYSRFSKLILPETAGLATRPLGHTLEIVPVKSPSQLKAGEPMVVQVLFRGKPLADAQVAAVYSGANLAGHEYPVVTRTDSNGRATLKLDRPGLWYARLIHMEPAQNDPEIEWRSYFGTLTFTVPGQ